MNKVHEQMTHVTADLELLEELAEVTQAPLQLPLLLLHHPGDRPPCLVLLQELHQARNRISSGSDLPQSHRSELAVAEIQNLRVWHVDLAWKLGNVERETDS